MFGKSVCYGNNTKDLKVGKKKPQTNRCSLFQFWLKFVFPSSSVIESVILALKCVWYQNSEMTLLIQDKKKNALINFLWSLTCIFILHFRVSFFSSPFLHTTLIAAWIADSWSNVTPGSNRHNLFKYELKLINNCVDKASCSQNFCRSCCVAPCCHALQNEIICLCFSCSCVQEIPLASQASSGLVLLWPLQIN